MNDQLEYLASLIDLDGPIHPNTANAVVLECDFEYGWLCSFQFNGQVVVLTPEWFASPEAAVADTYTKAVLKYAAQTGA